jgi:cytochrome d ubiquinol oxidase subunit I
MKRRIRNGIGAYALLQKLRSNTYTEADKQAFDKVKVDLGYGLLLKRYAPNVVDASEAQIKQAAQDTIPKVAPLFWSFRIMVAAGFTMLFIFAASFYYCAKRQAGKKRWLLKLALWGIPLPWIAAETGWVVAEYGRQPWSIGEILPTYLSTSTLQSSDVYWSLASIIGFYTLLLIVELYLMFRFARLGPSSLHTGRYHLEHADAAELNTQPQNAIGAGDKS